MATVTKIFHHDSYLAISPVAPQNSHSGHTVMITGSSSGIGLATAQAFVTAGATGVIILSRQQSLLDAALEQLEASKPIGSSTKIHGRVVSIASPESIEGLWKSLKAEGIDVDILVLNAGKTGDSPVLAMGSKHTWDYFETNVLAGLRMTEKLMQQGQEHGKVSNSRTLAVAYRCT